MTAANTCFRKSPTYPVTQPIMDGTLHQTYSPDVKKPSILTVRHYHVIATIKFRYCRHLAFSLFNTRTLLNLRDTRGHMPGNASDAPQHHSVGCTEHPPCFFAATSTTMLDDAMTVGSACRAMTPESNWNAHLDLNIPHNFSIPPEIIFSDGLPHMRNRNRPHKDTHRLASILTITWISVNTCTTIKAYSFNLEDEFDIVFHWSAAYSQTRRSLTCTRPSTQ